MDAIARAFWDGCSNGTLHYQRCGSCAHIQNYPRPFCSKCGGDHVSLQPSSGSGVIYTVAEVTRAPDPAFQALSPYYLALVDLDEGVRVMGHAAPEVSIGQRVKVTFRQHEQLALPLFVPA